MQYGIIFPGQAFDGAGIRARRFWGVAGGDEADKAGEVERGMRLMPVRSIPLSRAAGKSGAVRDGEVGCRVATATPSPRVRR